MKLQVKFTLGIILISFILSMGISIVTVQWVNKKTIREAENRVEVYIKAAWAIHNGKIARISSVLNTIIQTLDTGELLENPEDPAFLKTVRNKLEAVRKEQKMDILNLYEANGRVILRTRPPYNMGDLISNDPMVKQVILTKQSSDKNIILSSERLEIEGEELIERCIKFGGEQRGMLIGAAIPMLKDGNLVGILQMGNLLNGATEVVDSIRESVFENKQYKKRPVGTTTIFMGDLRVSTNVLDDRGKRAIGTRVSREVADHVLKKGNSWTGRAWVVNAWYLSQYDPIRDPEGNIIGMLYMGELEEKYLDMRTQAVISHLSVIIGGMILAFLVFFLITRTILRPIRKLAIAIKKLSERDLSYRVSVQTKDEVGILSKSFNQMAEELQEQHREIQKHQEALEKANQELQVINWNYMEMLGFVSHELKNPLSSAILGLHTVKDGYLGTLNPAQKKGLNSVAQSLDYFHDMIKNYLDLSRLEKGEIKVNKGRVLLCSEIVVPLLEELEPGINEKEMRVDNRISPEMEVLADRNLLRIVCDNLLSNAIKYGKQEGTIILDAQKEETGITMSIYNEGSGISQGKMNQLFKKFTRIDNPEYIGKKGTGLGLFICREIIEKQGGRIWAESMEGEWVKFTFVL